MIKVHDWTLFPIKERWAKACLLDGAQADLAGLGKIQVSVCLTALALLNAAYMFSAQNHQVPWLQG